MEIKTERLIIKRVREDNLKSLKPLIKYQSLFRDTGLTTNGIVNLTTLDLLAKGECLLEVIEESTNRVVGLLFLLTMYDENGQRIKKKYELGYLLAPPAQGKGLMTEAVRAVCEELRMREVIVIAETEKDNQKSKNVLEHSGFYQVTGENHNIDYWQYGKNNLRWWRRSV